MRIWCTAVVMVLFSPLVSANALPPVEFYMNTAYMCGGIGSDQASAFRSARPNYPLSLNFGQKQGDKVAFVADVQVVIRDTDEQTFLNINSEGPFCLLDIDPGHYQVFATYEGQTQQQSVEVTAQDHQLNFIWPEMISHQQTHLD